jgi:hypothetical protein
MRGSYSNSSTMRNPFKSVTQLEEGGTQKVVAKRSMSTVLTALLMFTLAADSHPFESRCRKQNSGAVTRTREAPASRFQAIARVYVSVVQN